MTQAKPTGTWQVLGWACFLAVSWTWCIGMYLPVILLRDLGWWSIAAFAVPNCLGAACMGVLLWRRDSSERLVRHHAHAVRWFSAITVAFQAWFLMTVIPHRAPELTHLVLAAAFGMLALLAYQFAPRSWRLLGPVGVLGASLSLGATWLASSPDLGGAPVAPSNARDLGPASAALVVGFLFCPYLDATFHAARRALPGRAGAMAFLLGFLVLFPLMIGWTVLYALPALRADAANPWSVLAPPVILHMVIQLAFTMGIHAGQPLSSPPTSAGARLAPVGVMCFLPILLASLTRTPGDVASPRVAFETVYLAFLGFYGLVAPAYVLVCVWGRNRIAPSPTGHNLLVFIAAVGAACPLFYLGFIDRQYTYLAPGVLILLAARALARHPSEPGPVPPSA